MLQVPCAGSRWQRERGFQGACPGRAWLRVLDLPFDEVGEEVATPDGLRPDVLLSYQGRPVLGIEIRVTHAVDEAKAARAGHPWVELDALQVLAAPRAWKPRGRSHPWTGTCRQCAWADQVAGVAFSEVTDPGDFTAELAAALFQLELSRWLRSPSSRARPGFRWRCPWCRKANLRALNRHLLLDAARASALGPPIQPEVHLELAGGAQASVRFGMPRRSHAILPLAPAAMPAIQVAPNPGCPLRLALNATNRPLAFLCRGCGRDCLGILPWAWAPVQAWE